VFVGLFLKLPSIVLKKLRKTTTFSVSVAYQQRFEPGTLRETRRNDIQFSIVFVVSFGTDRGYC
jgi:hypothetical protein